MSVDARIYLSLQQSLYSIFLKNIKSQNFNPIHSVEILISFDPSGLDKHKRKLRRARSK